MKRFKGRRARAMLLLFIMGVAAAFSAGARSKREFRASDFKTMLAGELEAVGLTADGAILPSPASDRIFEGEAAYVWSLLPDGKGGVYAATGSDGRVYHIREDGSWEMLAETHEYELFALTGSREDGLYVSGAPNGTITRVRADGTTETVIDLPEGIVWDMLVSPEGELFAATGEKGEIYRISLDGEAEQIGRIPDLHAVCMEWWQGRILCGSDGHGLLVALDPRRGEVEVLFDTAQEELVAILPLDAERVVFAANGNGQQPANESVSDLFLPPIAVRANDDSGGPALYELGPGGLVTTVWRCPEQSIHCLSRGPDGSVLVGTGPDGVLYSLDSLWNAIRLVDLEESQLQSIVGDGKRIFVGTGNGGAVYRLDWKRTREGLYTSRVWDAGLVSSWGAPHWIASGRGEVAMETRSGHVRDPGDTWSAWEPLQGDRVASPPGRFLQWRMRIKAERQGDLRIRSVSIPYRGPNRRPKVHSLQVSSKASKLGGASAGPRPGPVRQVLPGGVKVEYTFDEGGPGNESRIERPGIWARSLRTAAWKSQDPDEDPLRFDLYLRLLEDESFLPLKLDLEQNAYTWDAAAWPEGWYELKAVVRDEEGNPPGEGLRGEVLSAPFQIDNTPPSLRDLRLEAEGGRLILSGKAEDEISRIISLEFSLDGEGWRFVLPSDGILDSRSETFRVELPMLDEGRPPSVVGVRASDEVGHLVTARLRAPVLK